ncbi:MAG: hypothetical protein Q9227_003932 [Pyrenula ochraceoflavens]
MTESMCTALRALQTRLNEAGMTDVSSLTMISLRERLSRNRIDVSGDKACLRAKYTLLQLDLIHDMTSAKPIETGRLLWKYGLQDVKLEALNKGIDPSGSKANLIAKVLLATRSEIISKQGILSTASTPDHCTSSGIAARNDTGDVVQNTAVAAPTKFGSVKTPIDGHPLHNLANSLTSRGSLSSLNHPSPPLAGRIRLSGIGTDTTPTANSATADKIIDTAQSTDNAPIVQQGSVAKKEHHISRDHNITKVASTPKNGSRTDYMASYGLAPLSFSLSRLQSLKGNLPEESRTPHSGADNIRSYNREQQRTISRSEINQKSGDPKEGRNNREGRGANVTRGSLSSLKPQSFPDHRNELAAHEDTIHLYPTLEELEVVSYADPSNTVSNGQNASRHRASMSKDDQKTQIIKAGSDKRREKVTAEFQDSTMHGTRLSHEAQSAIAQKTDRNSNRVSRAPIVKARPDDSVQQSSVEGRKIPTTAGLRIAGLERLGREAQLTQGEEGKDSTTRFLAKDRRSTVKGLKVNVDYEKRVQDIGKAREQLLQQDESEAENIKMLTPSTQDEGRRAMAKTGEDLVTFDDKMQRSEEVTGQLLQQDLIEAEKAKLAAAKRLNRALQRKAKAEANITYCNENIERLDLEEQELLRHEVASAVATKLTTERRLARAQSNLADNENDLNDCQLEIQACTDAMKNESQAWLQELEIEEETTQRRLDIAIENFEDTCLAYQHCVEMGAAIDTEVDRL